ncbi:MAG: hypothetical protein QM737_12660 [Ferruginibacter sp.]
MNTFKLLFTATIASMLFSCTNNDTTEPSKEEAATADTATSMQMTAPPEAPAFKPFDAMEIKHSVKDYDKWRPAFDADSTERKASGIEKLVVARNMDKPNDVYMAFEVSDIQKAKDFGAAPRLKEVMDKAGVSSKPAVSFVHVVRFNPEAKEKKWVIITHKVKDFDAWVKVFDAEGTAARAEQGLYDAVMARDVNDPNMVTLVFDVKDVEKAKKSLMSEEKKKLMASAGVEGAPVVEFYNSVD